MNAQDFTTLTNLISNAPMTTIEVDELYEKAGSTKTTEKFIREDLTNEDLINLIKAI
jgi:hypothetical protein